MSDFFGELDRRVSQRLLTRIVPDEPELTKEIERHFQPDDLRTDYTDFLDAYKSGMKASGIKVDATSVSFSRNTEKRVTASDLALIMSYTDPLGVTRKRINLFQAKRLYLPEGVQGWTRDTPYRLSSEFGAFNPIQNRVLRTLEQYIGANVCRYLYYLPTTAGFPLEDREFIAGMQNRLPLKYGYFSNYALALRDALLSTKGDLNLGLWVSSTHHVARRAADVFGHAFGKMLPLSWFISGSLEFCNSSASGSERRWWELGQPCDALVPRLENELPDQPADMVSLENLVTGQARETAAANSYLRGHFPDISEIGRYERFVESVIRIELSSPRYDPRLYPLPRLDDDPPPPPRPGGPRPGG